MPKVSVALNTSVKSELDDIHPSYRQQVLKQKHFQLNASSDFQKQKNLGQMPHYITH